MIREAVQYLLEQGRAEAGRRVLRLEGDPPHITRWVDGEGEMQRIEVDPPPREVRLGRLADVVDLVKKHFDVQVSDEQAMAVFYGPEAVQVVFDTSTGREIAVLDLIPSAEDRTFRKFMVERKVPCLELRNLLRYELRECYRDERLEEQIAAINTANATGNFGTARRGVESLSATVLAESKVEGGLPAETQIFQVRRWANAELDVRYPVQVVLDPDAQTRSWIVHVLESSWSSYLQESLDTVGVTLRQKLEGTDVPIYQGSFGLVPPPPRPAANVTTKMNILPGSARPG